MNETETEVKRLFGLGVKPELIALLLTFKGTETLASAYKRFESHSDQVKSVIYGF
jgi:hypothetical protein